VALTYDHYGHLFPETDRNAAAKLDAIRASELDGRARWCHRQSRSPTRTRSYWKSPLNGWVLFCHSYASNEDLC
jgi:hypothetical protein